MTSISNRAQGRWRSLLTMLGIDSRYLTGKHGPCPICKGGTDRFRFDDKDGRGTWICSKCGAGDGFALLMKVKGWDFKEAAAEVEQHVGKATREVETRAKRSEKQLRDAMNTLWRGAKPVEIGDAVYFYLKARGIVLDDYPAAIRTADQCYYHHNGEGAKHPAMLAKVVAPDGKPVTIHRTYLTQEGRKANVDSPRRLMPGKITKGSAIRLGTYTNTLGIAEGIETALSAATIWDVPCWAAINSSMLMAWEPPVGVSEIAIFGDNDQKFGGQSAAYALAHRLTVQNLNVRVEMPPDQGFDWNDVLMADAEAA